MPELLIVADDITGALDTGVQLVKRNIPVRILLDPGCADWDSPDYPVLALAPETRRLSPAGAYRAAASIFQQARGLGIPYIYKKTDSALRGNIGAELQAMADAFGNEPICFAPAFPAAGRVTRDGIHSINGVPVADSPFGQDPFTPVTMSFIPAWLKEKGLTNPSRVMTEGVAADALPWGAMEGVILVYDAESDARLCQIASSAQKNSIRLLAGCAGFAQALPLLIGHKGKPPLPHALLCNSHSISGDALTVFSGSLNRITAEQIGYAVRHGFKQMNLSGRILSGGGREGLPGLHCADATAGPDAFLMDDTIVNTAPADATSIGDTYTLEDSREVSERLCMVAERLLRRRPGLFWMVVGGDTLMALMRRLAIQSIIPLCEIEAGVVLARATPGDYLFAAKSGGLGSVDVFLKVKRAVASLLPGNSL